MLTPIGIVKNLPSQEVWSTVMVYAGGPVAWFMLEVQQEASQFLTRCCINGLSVDECASGLGEWAAHHFGMTAFHHAGCDLEGNPSKEMWTPPESTSLPQPEELNPLVKILIDICTLCEHVG